MKTIRAISFYGLRLLATLSLSANADAANFNISGNISSNAVVLCNDQPVPYGMVIVNTIITQWPGCGHINTYYNAYIADVPYDYQVVCSVSPIPAGWMVISRFNTTECGAAWPNNSALIRRR